MSTTQVSIRLGVDGKAEVKRAFEEVGQAGTQAFGKVEQALDQAGRATERETARLRRLAEAARIAAQAETAQAQFNRVLGVNRPAAGSARASAEVFEQAARQTEEFEARAKALRAELDPVGAAQQRLNAKLDEYRRFAAAGAITQAEMAAATKRAQQAYSETVTQIERAGKATGFTRQQLMTFQYTFNDVAASLSTGMSPFTILLQQGGQVTQAFGGLRQTLQAVGGWLGPVGGSIAAVAAAVGVLGGAWLAADGSARQVRTAMEGIGRTSGATAGELERVAQSSAAAGNVSVRSARDMQVAFLRVGRIGADEIGRSITLARDLGATLGIDAKEAAELLAKALGDPARGADDLNTRLGVLDDRTRQYIRTLADQNQRAEAQRTILAAVKPALADAEQATNALARAWQFLGRAASNAYDALGRAVDRAAGGGSLEEERDRLLRRRESLRGMEGRPGARERAISAEIRLDELNARIDYERRRAAAAAAQARANELSVRAGEGARDILPGVRDIQRLREQEAALRSALADPDARAKLADIGQVEQAYQRIRTELARYRDGLGPAAAAAEKFRSSAAVAAQALIAQDNATEVAIRSTLALAAAYLESGEAARRAEARRQGLIDQAREGSDADTRARQALRERIAEQAAASAQQQQEIAKHAGALKQVNDAQAAGLINATRANQLLQQEQSLRPLLIAQVLAEGEAREKIARIIERTREAYAAMQREQVRADALRGIEARNDEIALRRREMELVRSGPIARREGLNRLQIEQEMKRMGIDPSSPEAGVSRAQVAELNRLARGITTREATFDYEQGNRALAREVELLKEGVAARSVRIQVIRAEQQLRRQGIDPGSGEGKAALAAAERQARLERQAEALVGIQEQRQEIALIEAQITLVGRSVAQRGEIMAAMRMEQDLRRRGIDLASEEGRQLVEHAVRIERLTQELQKQDAATRALEGAIGSALDRFADTLAQGKLDWKSWADAARSALQDITRELLRLAVINPLKNLLLGGNNPTLQNVGGLLGSLLGNVKHEGGMAGVGSMRRVPALLFAGAPRLHGGAFLAPDEVPAILQRGERVLNRQETADYNRARLTRGPAGAVVNVTIQTPNPAAFEASRTQMAAGLARAVQAGMRGL